MRTWLLGVVLAAAAPLPTVGATPARNTVSADVETEASLRRLGYRPPSGARRLSKLFPSKSGDAIAFFEQQATEVSLVVALRGGVSARWPVPPDSARLEVFWTGPSDLMIGADLLSPKFRVRWTVAQAR